MEAAVLPSKHVVHSHQSLHIAVMKQRPAPGLRLVNHRVGELSDTFDVDRYGIAVLQINRWLASQSDSVRRSRQNHGPGHQRRAPSLRLVNYGVRQLSNPFDIDRYGIAVLQINRWLASQSDSVRCSR